MFPLAKAFGWSLDYILWEVPMAVLNQANAYLLWRNGTQLRRVHRARVNRADIARKLGL